MVLNTTITKQRMYHRSIYCFWHLMYYIQLMSIDSPTHQTGMPYHYRYISVYMCVCVEAGLTSSTWLRPCACFVWWAQWTPGFSDWTQDNSAKKTKNKTSTPVNLKDTVPSFCFIHDSSEQHQYHHNVWKQTLKQTGTIVFVVGSKDFSGFNPNPLRSSARIWLLESVEKCTTFILRRRDLLSWHQARHVAVSCLSRDSSTSLAVRNISMFTRS